MSKAKKKTKKTTKTKTNKKPAPKRMAKRPPLKKTTVRGTQVVLLSGGNPQIAKGEGDAPIKAYIAALGDWKHDLVKRVDALIVKAVPGVQKAMKWNSPFYGREGMGWFVAYHVFAKYLKVTFFKGTSLDPVPPGPSKDPATRYYDIYEDPGLDEKQFTSWVKQAAALPGWMV